MSKVKLSADHFIKLWFGKIQFRGWAEFNKNFGQLFCGQPSFHLSHEPTGPISSKKGNFLHNQSHVYRQWALERLNDQIASRRSKAQRFPCRYASCNKAALETRGLRKKFLSHLKNYVCSRLVSLRKEFFEKFFFANKNREQWLMSTVSADIDRIWWFCSPNSLPRMT